MQNSLGYKNFLVNDSFTSTPFTVNNNNPGTYMITELCVWV